MAPNELVSNSTDVNVTGTETFLTSGELFDRVHAEMMRVNTWPLVFIFIYAILGCVGNSVVIYVYWTKWKRNKTRVFILCLGVLDLVNCVFNMPVEIAVLWQPITFDMHYLCKISRGCTFVMNNTGSLVFVSIAIERFLLVYYPFKYRTLTPTFAKGMCLGAFMIACSVSWPSFIFYGTQTQTITIDQETTGTTFYVRGKTCLIADEHEFRHGQQLIFTTILFALLILTFVVLTALYVAIGRKIYLATCTDLEDEKENTTRLFSKSIISALTGSIGPTQSAEKYKRHSSGYNIRNSAESPSSIYESTSLNNIAKVDTGSDVFKYSIRMPNDVKKPSRGANQNQARMSRKFSTVKARPTRKNTVMMRMVTIAFMLSFTPFLCILIIRYTNPRFYLTLNIPSRIAYAVFLRTYFINSMVNPFIYGFMNLKFRQHVKCLFLRLFCSRCCGKCRQVRQTQSDLR